MYHEYVNKNSNVDILTDWFVHYNYKNTEMGSHIKKNLHHRQTNWTDEVEAPQRQIV